jgi:hypothetical protein
LCSNKSQKSLGGGFGGAARREIVGIDSDGCSRKKLYGREKYTQAEKVKCECGKIEVMVFRKEGGKGQRGAGGNLIVNRRGVEGFLRDIKNTRFGKNSKGKRYRF